MSDRSEMEQLGQIQNGLSQPSLETPSRTVISPNRSPEEQSVIDYMARSRGRVWAEQHAEQLLTEARAIGNI